MRILRQRFFSEKREDEMRIEEERRRKPKENRSRWDTENQQRKDDENRRKARNTLQQRQQEFANSTQLNFHQKTSTKNRGMGFKPSIKFKNIPNFLIIKHSILSCVIFDIFILQIIHYR